ncbi:hypothetical protein RA241_003667 [Cronobacter sakazakii]|nr:hypothetical protein [Cronobacter sakazakii]
MKRKLIARNKMNVTGVLRYARRNFLFPNDAAQMGRYRSEVRMKIRHERRFGAEPDLSQAEPWGLSGGFIIPCVSSRGLICKHILVTAEKLEKMRNA